MTASVTEIIRLKRIERASRDLSQFLSDNVGETKDWPIQLIADDDYANPLREKLNEITSALNVPCES